MTTPTPNPVVEQRGPYTVTHRRIQHDRFGMQLLADTVVHPMDDGTLIKGKQYWVNFTHEAVLIFAVQAKQIYLIRVFTYAISEYSLEVPGGGVEAGETYEQAAVRELREELNATTTSFTYLGYTREITSRVNNTTHLFFTDEVTILNEAKQDSREIIEVVPLPLEQVFAMVAQGKITSAAVEVGLWRLRHLFLQ